MTLWPPMNLRGEFGPRMVEDLARRALLLDPPAIHQHHEIGQRHRLVLAVGDVDEGDAEFALQPFQFGAHAQAQERIERRQRLVQQQDLRRGDQRARQRHALLLAARELRRQPCGIGLHVDEFEQLSGFGVALRPWRRLASSARRRRCRSRTDAETAHRTGTSSPCCARRGQVGDVLRPDDDVARGHRFMARDHAQGRGLAAAGRAKQAAIGAGRNPELIASTAVTLPNVLVNCTNSNAAPAVIRIPSVLSAED